jgi:hypothetical protein
LRKHQDLQAFLRVAQIRQGSSKMLLTTSLSNDHGKTACFPDFLLSQLTEPFVFSP